MTPKEEIQAKFLQAIGEKGVVSYACDEAGISRDSAYRWRKEDETFARLWEDAMDRSLDLLEEEARRRAYNGVLRPVYQGGKKVGTIREYSDTLLMFVLKGGRPKKFRDNTSVEVTGPGGGPIKHEHSFDHAEFQRRLVARTGSGVAGQGSN